MGIPCKYLPHSITRVHTCVKCLLFLFDFNKNGNLSTYFSKTLQYEISWKCVLTVFKLWNANRQTSMAKLRGAFLQLLVTITPKTACWQTDMTSTSCIHLAMHFVRMLPCLLIFMLPFSAVALALLRFTFIGAMRDHQSVLESYRSAVLTGAEPSLQPPITYTASPSTATLCWNLEQKVTYFVSFCVSLVLTFICCWYKSIFLHKKQLNHQNLCSVIFPNAETLLQLYLTLVVINCSGWW
jgi:hypothetical protein